MSRVRSHNAWLGVVSTALVLAAVLTPSTIPTAGATTGIVTRSGQQFMLNGGPYRAGGSNQYYTTYRSQFMVRDALQTAASNNFQVMRVWGFLDLGNEDASNSLDPNANAYGVTFQFLRNGAPVSTRMAATPPARRRKCRPLGVGWSTWTIWSNRPTHSTCAWSSCWSTIGATSVAWTSTSAGVV